MLNKEYTILKAFIKIPWKKWAFKEIKKYSKNKSDKYVYGTLKKFVKETVLMQERIGNSILYSLNADIHAVNTISYVSEYLAIKNTHLPMQNIQKLIENITTPDTCIIITGSYAKGTQQQTSDLDIIILCTDPKEVIAQVRLESELMIPQIHPYAFTHEEFYKMLTNNEENYGKQAARNNFIITNATTYYNILLKAIKHGFNG